MRTSAPSLLACKRLFLDPGTRMASPNVVRITPGISASLTQSSTRPIGSTQTVHQLDLIGQHSSDTVAEYRVRMSAAHFHDLQRAPFAALQFGGQAGDFLQQRFRFFRIPEFVDIFHALPPSLIRVPQPTVSRVHQPTANVPDPTGCDRSSRGIPESGGCYPLPRSSNDRARLSPLYRRSFRRARPSSAPSLWP